MGEFILDNQIFGFKHLKLDLLFILAGGEKVEKNFSYDQQRNYYIKEFFGNTGNEKEIIAYGKQPHKLAYEYMFPNNPAGVRNFKLLVRVFAVQVLLRKMFEANDFYTAAEEFFVQSIQEKSYHFSDPDIEKIFIREIKELHRQYIRDFSIENYEEFKKLMEKFNKQFCAVADKVEKYVTSDRIIENYATKRERKPFLNFERMKLDLLFILAGGEKVEKNFSYDQQRNYYIKEFFGATEQEQEIIAYGKNYKLVSEYIFPNNPNKLTSRKFFFEFFADCIFFNQIYAVNDYNTFKDKNKIQNNCFGELVTSDVNAEEIFKNEIQIMYSKYSRSISADEYKNFISLMQKFYDQFSKILNALKIAVAAKISSKGTEKNDSFNILCKKLGISSENSSIFKLKIDALAEIQIGNNTHVDYFESLKKDWKEKFPQYIYCEEFENYINQEKYSCTLAFGNKLNSIRSENVLFELLAAVRVKLALSDGAANLEQLNNNLNNKAENFSDELKKAFIENTKKIIAYYSLNKDANYNPTIKAELVPYRANLLYIEEILVEEILHRDKKSVASKTSRTDSDSAAESEMSKYEKKYNLIISQKDAEIYSLKRDLEYYENIKSQEFRSDFQGYDDALMTLFQRMCGNKYGAPLNELYLMSLSDKEIKLSDIKNIVKNLLFIFDSMGINPYEVKNIGKTINFDSDDANVVYSVNENEIIEGINKGLLKYPGWKQRGKEIVLPLIVMNREGDPDE